MGAGASSVPAAVAALSRGTNCQEPCAAPPASPSAVLSRRLGSSTWMVTVDAGWPPGPLPPTAGPLENRESVGSTFEGVGAQWGTFKGVGEAVSAQWRPSAPRSLPFSWHCKLEGCSESAGRKLGGRCRVASIRAAWVPCRAAFERDQEACSSTNLQKWVQVSF